MKLILYIVFLLLIFGNVHAQIIEKDTTKMGYVLEENDTITEPILLEEVIIFKEKLDPESKKQFLLLQNRVYKTYPFARIASDRLTAMNKTMDKLKTAKEKRKYFKIVENYMENEFTAQLKKLSRKQGQILVKLIHRQTGTTTYDLIKDAPYHVNEDYLIETILFRAFNRGRLVKQDPALPIDYDNLSDFWEKKAISKN